RALNVQNGTGLRIDHCTFGWAMDENMTINPKPQQTVDDVMFAHCLNVHSLRHSYHPDLDGQTFGHGHACFVGYGAQRIVFYRGLNAHHMGRALGHVNAQDAPVTVSFINMVVYNWQYECFALLGTPAEGTRINLINCLCVEGPDTQFSGAPNWRGHHSNKAFRPGEFPNVVHISGCKVLRL